MPERVVVFIDAQNMYQGARRAFFQEHDHYTKGQLRPDALAELLAHSGPPGADRVLEGVRVYTGRPDATKSPKSYAAHMRQCAAWRANGVTVVARMLRYPTTWPREKEQEKGIDVALAIDFVSMVIDDRYDVGILASTDTDLKPALEYVTTKSGIAKTAEVAAWRSERARMRLGVGNRNVWCHWLDFGKYQMLADTTDYAR